MKTYLAPDDVVAFPAPLDEAVIHRNFKTSSDAAAIFSAVVQALRSSDRGMFIHVYECAVGDRTDPKFPGDASAGFAWELYNHVHLWHMYRVCVQADYDLESGTCDLQWLPKGSQGGTNMTGTPAALAWWRDVVEEAITSCAPTETTRILNHEEVELTCSPADLLTCWPADLLTC